MPDEKVRKRGPARPKTRPVDKTPSVRKAKPAGRSKAATAPPENSLETLYAPIDRLFEIEREAYFRAERRGFEPGHELEDWLAAEQSIGARA